MLMKNFKASGLNLKLYKGKTFTAAQQRTWPVDHRLAAATV